jgi:hypothetical protein
MCCSVLGSSRDRSSIRASSSLVNLAHLLMHSLFPFTTQHDHTSSVIYGLIYLFYEPNPDDPLNHEAAELFRKDVRQFERLVSRTLRGGILDGVQFERLV